MPLTPEQRRRRDQFESLSRIVGPEDDEYYPIRSGRIDPQIGVPPERTER